MTEHDKTNDIPLDDRGRTFMRLYVANERRIYAFIFTLVHNWTAADDVLQDTAQVLWSKFHEFDPDTDFMAWALCIARNKVMSYMRTQNRRHAFNARLAAQLDQRALEYAEDDNHVQEALSERTPFGDTPPLTNQAVARAGETQRGVQCRARTNELLLCVANAKARACQDRVTGATCFF